MATIGTLSVSLTMATAAFNAGAAAASKTAQGLSNNLGSIKRAAVAAASALGIGLSFAAFKGFIQGSAETIGRMATLSDTINISTEDLAGFQHAANLAGVDAESLGAALKKMVVSIGEGDKSFAALGLSVGELKNLDAGEAFKRIAEKIDKLPNQATKAAAAVAIFGKSGVALLPTLAGGRAGLEAMQKEAQKLGLSFSRIDAAKVVEANDALTRIKESIQGLGNALAIQLAPYITAAANEFLKFATAGEGVAARVANGMRIVGRAVGVVADIVNALQLGFQRMQLGFAQAMAGIVGLSAKAAATLGLPMADAWGKFSTELNKDLAKMEKQFDAAFIAPPPSAKWEKWFNDIAKKGNDVARGAIKNYDAKAGGAVTGPYRPVAPFLQGSREAFSAIARFRDGRSTDPATGILRNQQRIQQQLLDEARRQGRGQVVFANF